MIRLTESEAVMLAYISSFGPPGVEISLNIHALKEDLEYEALRSIYVILKRLKIAGVARTCEGKRRWGETHVTWYIRPEACEIVGPRRHMRKKRGSRPRKKIEQTAPDADVGKAVKRLPPDIAPEKAVKRLIPYAGMPWGLLPPSRTAG
jgi:hypothetical protein